MIIILAKRGKGQDSVSMDQTSSMRGKKRKLPAGSVSLTNIEASAHSVRKRKRQFMRGVAVNTAFSKARQDKKSPDQTKTRQFQIGQDKKRPDKTRPEHTRQDKTRQDKTKKQNLSVYS
jgi:hypothetical protein